MTESEWKLLRTVKEAALDRLCARILEQSKAVIEDASASTHERYLRLFTLIREGDDDVAWAFNGLRRSTADQQFAVMVKLGLVTDEELARFSEKTREGTRMLAGLTK
jgi:hypothetical protein